MRTILALTLLALCGCDIGRVDVDVDVDCPNGGSFHGSLHNGEGGLGVRCYGADASMPDSTVLEASADATPGVDVTIDSGAQDSASDAAADGGTLDASALLLTPASWAPTPSTFAGIVTDAGTLSLVGASNANAYRYGGAHQALGGGNSVLDFGVTLRAPTNQTSTFFGFDWSVWPDKSVSDSGYDVAVWIRSTFAGGLPLTGYRLQFSSYYQDLALVKWPTGGYVRSRPLALAVGQRVDVSVQTVAHDLVVSVAGAEVMRFRDPDLSTAGPEVGFGVGPGARADISTPTATALPPAAPIAFSHVPAFSSRTWLGGRTWLFDGDEPIVQLPTPSATLVTNAKIRPGYRPQLAFNSYWDISNQGAYPLGTNTITTPVVSGGGATITAAWTAQQTTGRFTSWHSITLSYDAARDAYAYDSSSELTVVGQPFTFSYGLDFDHQSSLHTNDWNYQVVQASDGSYVYRPVYPIDPGLYAPAKPFGRRFWVDPAFDEHPPLVPETQYAITSTKKLNTAICAAFNDSGFGFVPETNVAAGTVYHADLRYTGLASASAEATFASAVVEPLAMLDPTKSYAFAEWPTQSFPSRALNQPWPWPVNAPYLTAHGAVPTYGAASGSMILGPGAFASADLPIPAPLAAGRYLVSGLTSSAGLRGPGARIEVTPGTGAKVTSYLGAADAGEHAFAFSFTTATSSPSITLGFGNTGTGTGTVKAINVRPLLAGEGDVTPAPPVPVTMPSGALADWRVDEGQGRHVFDGVGGLSPRDSSYGIAEMMNLAWTFDGGLPALVFGPEPAVSDVIRWGLIDGWYLSNPNYAPRRLTPALVAGYYGFSKALPAFTLVTWAKPGATQPAGKADVVGLGARRAVISLVNMSAPYKLAAWWNGAQCVQTSTNAVTGSAWHQLAVTGEADGSVWHLRVYLDGAQAAECWPTNYPAWPGPLTALSLVWGSDVYYLSGSFYRGLIGRTTILDHAATLTELQAINR